MSVILDAVTALAIEAGADSPAAWVRSESKLLSTQLGYTSAEIESRWDVATGAQLSNRAAIVKAELDSGAAGIVDWASNSDVVQLAANSTVLYCIGYLKLQAAQRGDKDFFAQAQEYFALAQSALDGALKVVALLKDAVQETPRQAPRLGSMSVQTITGW